MKKTVKTLLAILMCLMALSFRTNEVSAASVGTSGPSQAKEGDTFTITVSVNSEAVTSGSIEISCSSSLEIVSGQWMLSGTTLATYDNSRKKGAFAFSSPKSLSGSYFKITVKAKSMDKAAKVTATVQLKNGDSTIPGGSSTKTINIGCKNHSWGDWVEHEGTCTTPTTRTRTCSVCGATETETLAAEGHDVKSYSVTTEPTCTEPGVESGECSRCHKTVTRSIPELGHEFGEWVETKKSTCFEHGEETRTCVRCGETETREAPLTEHEFPDEVTVIREPTLTKRGIAESKCLNCSQTIQYTLDCQYVDDKNGIAIECKPTTFTDGSEITVREKDPTSNEVVYGNLNKITGKSRILDINCNNGNETPRDFTLYINIPEDFSDNVAVARIDRYGKLEIVNCSFENGDKGRRAVITTNQLGNYTLIDLEAVPEDKAGIPTWWKYVAFGEGGAIALLLLLLAKKKKKEEPVAEAAAATASIPNEEVSQPEAQQENRKKKNQRSRKR